MITFGFAKRFVAFFSFETGFLVETFFLVAFLVLDFFLVAFFATCHRQNANRLKNVIVTRWVHRQASCSFQR